MYISRVQIKNVRCFENLDLRLDLRGKQIPWTMIVGDNATGKTALLRSIAIGLCDESSAAGLLKEAEEGYIRRGKEKEGAKIIVWLKPNPMESTEYKLTTTIRKIATGKGSFEQVRQPSRIEKEKLPWNDIFICAYGAGRGTSGTGDITGYTPINAVYNLFNYSEGLQNPELTIHRLGRKDLKAKILRILSELMIEVKQIQLRRSRITFDGPWGNNMPLRDLADGYKSTFLWVTDLWGWALSHNPSIKSSQQIEGVILVDEIEQHLHPLWQEQIIGALRKQFPRIQFITTTHSPIIASSIGQDLQNETNDKLILLEHEERKVVKSEYPEKMKGWSIDQVLASRAFKYLVRRNPNIDNLLREASRLAEKGKERTKADERRYADLKSKVADLFVGERQTPVERELEEQNFQEIQENINKLEKKLFGSKK